MINLPIDLDKFGFVEREKMNGVFVKYKCGRDFIYYALHFFLPSVFNAQSNNPTEIDKGGLFGVSLPFWGAWTQLQFLTTPALLRKYDLQLRINKRDINTFFDFVSAILFSKMEYSKAVSLMEQSVSSGHVVGMDIALRFSGLEDHVMFVYGYDEMYWYVFDTHEVKGLGYEKMTNDTRYLMKISRDEVQSRWRRFSRVWEVSKK
jgi:hypothetical protein